MLRSVTVLFFLSLSWIGALWFALPIELNALSYPRLILLHASPPVLLFLMWLFRRMWHKRRQALAEERQRSEEEAKRLVH